MAKKSEFQVPATIAETIYLYLKKAILEGRIKPRQRLQEKDISKLFSVSSTPVREAFHRLAAEKYLVINARREVLVQGKSLAEVKELYEIVRALDLFALKKYVVNFKETDIQKLKEMTKRLSDYYSQKNVQSYLQQNLKIHDRIWQACGNKSLHETLIGLMEKIAIFRMHNGFAPFSEPAALDKSYRDHLNLIEAIEMRDVERLEKLISAHWGEEFFIEKSDSVEKAGGGENKAGNRD